MRVDVGDRITKGQALAVLDKRTYNLNVRAAEAEVGRAKVQLADKRNDLDRFQRINKQDPGAVSQAALDQSQAAVDSAIKQVQFSGSQLKLALRDLEKTVLRAPFDGVITKKLVEEGDPVQPGQPMLEFADMSILQIQVEVPARLMPGVKKGMVFNARLDVGDVDIQARVVQVFPIADTDRHTVTVKMELPPGAPGGAGMYAEVMINDINAQVRDLPVVPVNALVWRGSLPGIYVLNEDNQRELRLVRTGDQVGTDGIAILSGLRAGERIVVSGTGGGAGEAWR